MKQLSGIWMIALVGLMVACTDIENQQPQSDFEKSNGPLPAFDLPLDSNGVKTIRFDSIAQGGNFSLTFTPMTFGNIKIVEAGKAVQIQMQGHNWKKDSTEYTICKSKVCRYGKIVLYNSQYEPPDSVVLVDTSCSELPIRIIYVNFNTSIDIGKLFPFGGRGTIDSLKSLFYSAINKGDSTIIFTSSGVDVEQPWAWDTLSYQLKASNRKCWTGKIAVVLGDTICQAQARPDALKAPGGLGLWHEDSLVANDVDCTNQLGPFETRTPYDYDPLLTWDYSSYKEMLTRSGILLDTGIIDGPNPGQYYKYRRTNPSAAEDGFYYYFKNETTNRVTKAWVKITF